MLTADLLTQLQSAAGRRALAAADEAIDLDPDYLRAAQHLERAVPAPLARAAVEQALLRRHAAAKFSDAQEMFFTREALEQATSEAVARNRARRYGESRVVLDLGCGIGGDALALAEVAPVIAVDLDLLRLRILQANAARRGPPARIRLVRADATRRFLDLPRGTAGFADPSRRSEGRRIRRVESAQPPLAALVGWLPHLTGLGVKVSPAVDLESVRRLECEVEFVSLEGELKEATLWFGSLRKGTRRATLLPEGLTLEGDAPPELPVAPLGSFLIEPDPAVMRAGLVTAVGVALGARLVSPGIGYLTADHAVRTPWGRVFRVLRAEPFRLRGLQAILAEGNVGRLTIKRRGSPVEPEAIEKKLRLAGPREATVILTRLMGVSSMVLVEPLEAASA